MPLSIFLLNCTVLLLIIMDKNNFYVICEKIEHGFILHNIVLIHVSSQSINYVRSTQNKTVFSLDLSGLQTPRSFQFKLSLKGFFLDKGVCINQENVLLYCEVFLSLYVSDLVYLAQCLQILYKVFQIVFYLIHDHLLTLFRITVFLISDRCVVNRKFSGLSGRARKHPSNVLTLPADQIVDMAAG